MKADGQGDMVQMECGKIHVYMHYYTRGYAEAYIGGLTILYINIEFKF